MLTENRFEERWIQREVAPPVAPTRNIGGHPKSPDGESHLNSSVEYEYRDRDRVREMGMGRDLYIEESDGRYSRPNRRRTTFDSESHSRHTSRVREHPDSLRRQSLMRSRRSTDDWDFSYARRHDAEIQRRPSIIVRTRGRSPLPIEYREPKQSVLETEIEPTNVVQTIWTTETKQDSTVHFELEIEQDFEGCVEEFTRLSRVGNFSDADAYFQANLSDDYLHLPDMALLYADMLLEQGSYNRFYKFTTDNEPAWPERYRNLYSAKWDLTIACADMRARGNLQTAFECVDDMIPLPLETSSLAHSEDPDQEHWSMSVSQLKIMIRVFSN
jgi:hypothetical protein